MNDKLRSVLTSKFLDFYAAVNGYPPYQWQTELMLTVAEEGTWPDRITAPTGSGKSSSIEVHIFLNAVAGSLPDLSAVPRRLCLVVNRRALVDSQHEKAVKIATILRDASPSEEALFFVKQGLLCRAGARCGSTAEPLLVTSIRGGSSLNPEWRYHPEAVQIIAATPDMFGSRLLFRGYGTSKMSRPIEAGLFAYDCVVIIDEAHLNRQLAKTARQIPRIEAQASQGIGANTLQVVECTATQVGNGEQLVEMSINELGLRKDRTLWKRVNAKKHVFIAEGSQQLTHGSSSYIHSIATYVMEELKRGSGSVAVILNTVATALAVDCEVRKLVGDSPEVVLTIGRMRPADRQSALGTILDSSRKDAIVIIGTQALEVGIDYDCRVLVTEMAPVQVLVQRLGRLNRFGRYDHAICAIYDALQKRSPYDEADIEIARLWVEQLPEGGVNSLDLQGKPIPTPKARRKVFQRLESWDAKYLSHTSEELATDFGVMTQDCARTDLDLWLRDEIGAMTDHDAYVVVREQLPKQNTLAANLLTRVPPLSAEMFPCSISRLREWLSLWTANDDHDRAPRRLFVSKSGGDYRCFTPADIVETADAVTPGDILIFDAETTYMFASGTVLPAQGQKTLEPQLATDVYARTLSKLYAVESIHGVPILINRSDSLGELLGVDSAELESLCGDVLSCFESEDEEAGEVIAREIIRSWLEDHHLTMSIADCEIIVEHNNDGGASCVYIIAHPELGENDNSGKEIIAENVIGLNEHQEQVAESVKSLAQLLGLSPELTRALHQAGMHHDDGKVDRRFQTMLRGGSRFDGTTLLAKSSPTLSRTKALRLYNALGLKGWRHEQLSIVLAWESVKDCDRELAVRLIGTSHGRGRSAFERGSQITNWSVFADDSRERHAGQFFDVGLWEELVAVTDGRYGFWGASYLEALLRAADIRSSRGDVSWR